ncbi:MAG: TonB-dependent receptor [Myxococcota bacterium]
MDGRETDPAGDDGVGARRRGRAFARLRGLRRLAATLLIAGLLLARTGPVAAQAAGAPPGAAPARAAAQAPTPAASAEETARLFESADDEWVVSASRIPSTASKPYQASVIDAKALDTGISPSVADALRFVPGLHLVQEGAAGGRAALALRGLDPNHVVVLIDGVRVNDPTNSRGGSFDPTTLALVDIERIEVVRGPLSSIHGADALAGVVQIVTKGVDADAPLATRVRARYGRYHTAEVAGQASAGVGGVAGLALGAALNTSRDPHSDGGFDGANLHAKLRVPLPFEVDFEAFTRLHQSSARAFPESSGGPELAVLRNLDDRDAREVSFGASLVRGFADDSAHVRLQGSRATRREDLVSAGIELVGTSIPVVPASRTGDEYGRWDASLVADGELPALDLPGFREGARVVGGVAGIWEEADSDTALQLGQVLGNCRSVDPQTGFARCPYFAHRRTASVFGELEQPIGPHVVVSGSARFDATPDEEDRISPSVGIVSAIPGTRFHVFGRYGQGFRRPSFYALDNPLVGNPSLGIERSRGFEAGLRYRSAADAFGAQLGYFDLEVENLHDFDAQLFRIVGRGRLISRGVEAQLDWRPLPIFELVTAASFNPTDFGGTSRAPQNRPRWRGFAELHARPFPKWDFLVRALAVGPSKASAAAIGGRVVTLAGYERIDLRATWTPLPGLDVYFEIENATNRTRREAVGFESPGIAPRVGVALYH